MNRARKRPWIVTIRWRIPGARYQTSTRYRTQRTALWRVAAFRRECRKYCMHAWISDPVRK